jgi:RNA polymerase sigma-70 factor (ECF subfamily)
MREGDEQGAVEEPRRITYCVIPLELAGQLHDPLRRHFRDDPSVEVVVDRRRHERRARPERRAGAPDARPKLASTKADEDRRAIRNPAGRRVGDRRAVAVPVPEDETPALPRRARRFADRLRFHERVEPASDESEDFDTARTVIAYQAGDASAFHLIYERYFDRVYSYLRLMLRDSHEAEDAAQDVFETLMGALRTYERTDRPFRGWLFTVVRNHAIRLLRRSSRVEVVDAASLHDQRENGEPSAEDLRVLEWISETDLLMLVERLPADQRQVLAMRYVLDLKPTEIAEILGISANHASVLHYRAINFLRTRLERLGRTPASRGNRARMRAFPKQAQVLRRRRFVLTP